MSTLTNEDKKVLLYFDIIMIAVLLFVAAYLKRENEQLKKEVYFLNVATTYTQNVNDVHAVFDDWDSFVNESFWGLDDSPIVITKKEIKDLPPEYLKTKIQKKEKALQKMRPLNVH